MLGPEIGQEFLHAAESAGVDHEQVVGAFAALVEQACLVQQRCRRTCPDPDP